MHLDRLFQRLFPVSQTRTARRRGEHRLTSPARSRRRAMQVESLEERRVLTVLYVANDADFTDAANPGSPQANDSVTWNGGGQFTAPVSGLTFGVNAFDSINAAVVGILLAALYDPVWTSAVHSGRDFALVIVALALLGWWRLPSWAVVLLTALLAWWVV